MLGNIVKKQQGAALFIALIFLVIITLIAVTAMRTSTLELLMAVNDQARKTALDSAASASDAVIGNSSISIGNAGDIDCFQFGASPDDIPSNVSCTTTENPAVGEGYSGDNVVWAEMKGIGNCPPGIATSASGNPSLRTSGGGAIGGCAYYAIDSLVDATDKRGGRAHTVEGYIQLAF